MEKTKDEMMISSVKEEEEEEEEEEGAKEGNATLRARSKEVDRVREAYVARCSVVLSEERGTSFANARNRRRRRRREREKSVKEKFKLVG